VQHSEHENEMFQLAKQNQIRESPQASESHVVKRKTEPQRIGLDLPETRATATRKRFPRAREMLSYQSTPPCKSDATWELNRSRLAISAIDLRPQLVLSYGGLRRGLQFDNSAADFVLVPVLQSGCFGSCANLVPKLFDDPQFIRNRQIVQGVKINRHGITRRERQSVS
jgi:hypothetical protein